MVVIFNNIETTMNATPRSELHKWLQPFRNVNTTYIILQELCCIVRKELTIAT